MRTVKVKRINSQVTTSGYNIDHPDPGTIAVNELDTSGETCCLGAIFTVLQVKSRTTNVYP